MAKNYINNKDFYEAIKEYRKACAAATEEGKPQPIIPDYIGECFYKIATRLAYKPNFINYTYRDEMISDGLENAVIAAVKFDPEQSENPFAYFTQIIWFAFLRRIQKEKKQQYVKYKCMENSIVHDDASVKSETNADVDVSIYDIDSDHISTFIRTFEDSMRKKKEQSDERPKPKQGLEVFIDEEAV